MVKLWTLNINGNTGFVWPGALEKARENFKIKLKKLQKYAVQVLQTFDIEKDGYYYFQCSISRNYGTIYDASVRSKSNVAKINSHILGPGFVLVVLGLLFQQLVTILEGNDPVYGDLVATGFFPFLMYLVYPLK